MIDMACESIQFITGGDGRWVGWAAAQNLIFPYKNKLNNKMTQFRRTMRAEELKRCTQVGKHGRQSKSKLKHPLYTDPSTTDCTKSSTDLRNVRFKNLEQLVGQLQRQNHQLRNQLISLKAEQFVRLNEEKLKGLILENEELQKQILESRCKVNELQIDKELLHRKNEQLKLQCQTLKKSIKYLKTKPIEPKPQTHSSVSDLDEICKSIYKSASTHILTRRQHKSTLKPKKQPEPQKWNCDYFQRKKKNF